MTVYDNRSLVDHARYQLDRLIGAERNGRGKAHFVFRTNGKRIGYCYIRKNACSAFKRLIVDSSEHRHECPDTENPIQFMNKYHIESSLPDLASCDATIFVFRDPITRLSSVFVNKFIVRSGNEDIFANFRQVTGMTPGKTSYRDFVYRYAAKGPLDLDPHVWPQNDHLHSIKYSHAVHIGDLVEEMAPIIGSQAASFYFASRINASEGSTDDTVSDFSDRTSDELRELYLAHGILPRHEQMAPQSVLDTVADLYVRDLSLYRNLMQARSQKAPSEVAAA